MLKVSKTLALTCAPENASPSIVACSVKLKKYRYWLLSFTLRVLFAAWPPQTLSWHSQNGSTVYVLKSDQTVELRTVKVARAAGDNTLLASGVKAGEVVITDGQLRLLPGMKAEARAPSGAPLTAEAGSPDKSMKVEARP